MVLSSLVPAWVTALVTVMILTPFVQVLAIRVGAVDMPNNRKVHTRPTPRLGGVAVLGGISAGVGLYVWLTHTRLAPVLLATAAGAVAVALVGMVDDIRGLRPWTKLVLELLAALLPVSYGLQIKFVSLPFDGLVALRLEYVMAVVTILWIVGVTNAVNLSDGLDGLATGLALVSALVIAVYSYAQGITSVTVVSSVVAAAALGFLVFNVHPARIFLGDSGSLMLGYVLGSLSVMGVAKGATLLTLFVPLFIMGVPVVDTLAAIIRRAAKRRPVFQPDKEHLHHKLMDHGFSYDQSVYFIYTLSALSGGFALVLGRVPLAYYLLALLLVGLILAAILTARAGERRRMTRVGNPTSVLTFRREAAASTFEHRYDRDDQGS